MRCISTVHTKLHRSNDWIVTTANVRRKKLILLYICKAVAWLPGQDTFDKRHLVCEHALTLRMVYGINTVHSWFYACLCQQCLLNKIKQNTQHTHSFRITVCVNLIWITKLFYFKVCGYLISVQSYSHANSVYCKKRLQVIFNFWR